MELIVVILIFVLISLSGKGKKKQGSAAAKSQASAPRQRAAQSSAVKLSPEERKARLAELRQRREARTEARPTVVTPEQAAETAFEESLTELKQLLNKQGDSPLDGEGCVGGSMEHDHAEGESREEHARHMAAIREQEREESLAAQALADASALNARKLRQAVVMAEVLGKPKALKRGMY